MAKNKLIAGNWKMHHTTSDALQFLHALKERPMPSQADVLIAPPFTLLPSLSGACKESGIFLAGQNMHSEPKGPFTGEISASMLLDAGCSHVILGHSERRHVFGESNELIARKLAAARDSGLIPILCIGETQQERQADQTEAVISRQLESALDDLAAQNLSDVILAYEPVWAIGTGNNATPEQAQTVHGFIRAWLDGECSDSQSIRILYGGSVTPENAASLLGQGDIDGLLVGSASLDADSFYAIISAVN